MTPTGANGLGEKPIRAVVFDLDDTLYPQQQYVLSGFRAVAEFIHNLYGVDLYRELAESYLAGTRQDLFATVLKRHFKTVEEHLLRKLLYVHRTHNPVLELYQDARVCLAQLIGRGLRVGVLTDGSACIQRRKVAALEIEPLVDAIVYSDDLLGSRQSLQLREDAFQIMALQLEVDFAETVYVGDNPLVDFVTPRRLGLRTVRIQRSRGEHAADEPPTPECAPDLTLQSLCFLADLLASAPR